ncbi:alpha-glucosidase [Anaeramoeba flamelloides]|uniref:Maltase n=1 Tax=Anaeramoeba flamelloides TaxID=1746091 RepID=A0ABQ8YSA7_9EUKA|nr:alpha-glucosidase [Anaeramoeba flamelloides]
MHSVLKLLIFFFLFAQAFTSYPGYKLENVVTSDSGFTGDLALISAGPYGNDYQKLALYVNYQTNSRLRVKIYPANEKYYEVPFVVQVSNSTVKPTDMDYEVTYETNPFSLTIKRKSDQTILFDTNTNGSDLNGLIFEKNYLELSTNLEKDPILFGLGERKSDFVLELNQTYTLFANSQNKKKNQNRYSSYPVYYQFSKASKTFHSVFFVNSDPTDFVLMDNSLTFKSIGGIIDLFVFTGPSFDEAANQLSDVIGKPSRISYWNLGWHQSRYGWKTLDIVKQVVNNFTKLQLPLETIYSDIDCMDNDINWTFDPVRYPQADFRAFVDELHNDHRYWIPITDIQTPLIHDYLPYTLGNEKDIFIKNPVGNPYWGILRHGPCMYPDFTHPNSTDYWTQILENYYNKIPFDGLWIDMNEPDNYESIWPKDKYDFPYTPGNQNLDRHTVPLECMQYYSQEIDLHNMYGYSQSRATRFAMETILPQKRSFILTRSSFIGLGNIAQTWTGDNDSTFESMKESISTVLHSNTALIPMIGADICGYSGDVTEELCIRWYQLGTFYPFSRNHNHLFQREQLPYSFGDNVTTIIKNYIDNRYYILPYLYSLFEKSSREGNVIWRVMLYDYPEDSYTWYLGDQIMVGDSLMILPVLESGQTGVEGYFPNDNWYDWWSGKQIMEKLTNQTHGLHIEMLAPIESMPVIIKGGSIIPTQIPALTSAESRLNNFELIIALDPQSEASGWLYLDDGESVDIENKYTEIKFTLSNNKLESEIIKNDFNIPDSASLHYLKILGIKKVSLVIVNGKSVDFEYDNKLYILEINDLDIDLNNSFTVEFTEN